jgi:type IV secretory pathway protease TraF
MQIKGNPEALKAYRDRKGRALAKTAAARKAEATAKTAVNQAEAK